jgi:hypothetical protein
MAIVPIGAGTLCRLTEAEARYYAALHQMPLAA